MFLSEIFFYETTPILQTRIINLEKDILDGLLRDCGGIFFIDFIRIINLCNKFQDISAEIIIIIIIIIIREKKKKKKFKKKKKERHVNKIIFTNDRTFN